MIVEMLKLYIVSRKKDRDRLMNRLQELGVVHLVPVDPAKTVLDETTQTSIRNLDRAIQVLSNVSPSGETPKMDAMEAAEDVLEIQLRTAERQNRLTTLYRRLEEVEKIWGEVSLRQIDLLSDAGIDVQFYAIPKGADVSAVQAELVQVVNTLSDGRMMVAVVQRKGTPVLPEGSEGIKLPSADAETIRSEASEIDRRLKEEVARLSRLANLLPLMKDALNEQKQKAEYALGVKGATQSEHLFAVQGWIPKPKAESLVEELEKANIDAAVETINPSDDETPPTLLEIPAWAKPIQGLFDILGTVSGYREFDVSIPFMVALPIFAAMLIGDGGYGLLLLLALTIGYKKAAKGLGEQFTKLMIVISATTLAWGMLGGSCFGFTLYTPIIPVDTTEESRNLLMNISFIMGTVHLCFAHLWHASRIFPNLKFLNEVGWATIIAGMLGVVRMFVMNSSLSWSTPWPYLLISGTALAILFHTPSWNLFKAIGLGLANFPLSLLSSFSDIISYVRLMAVGLAGTVLAVSFNDLAMSLGHWVFTLPVMICGHALNIGLALIALFAHGVRLNMLEFSNNLGMQWTGYLYKPFARRMAQEKVSQ